MKKLALFILSLIFVLTSFGISFGQNVHVRGYTKKNGTYVQPHYRSRPDGNVFNNWSTQGNTNPYTGKRGTVNPYKSSRGFGSAPGGFSQPQSYGRSNNRWNGQSSGGMGDSFSGDNFQFRPRSKRGDLLFGR